jgi:sigma-B regulation protein RsbU (phosphoserine phosphatase)
VSDDDRPAKELTLTEERAIASALQRSLLPGTLPSIRGLELAARYIPAEGNLGGDWYDVFKLPNDNVGIVMGDVAGHGLHSAVVMGRLRSALRAYALDHDDPAEVLRRLDRKIQYFEPGAMATVIYGITAPPFEHIRLSSAGHLPPLLAVPGERSELIALPRDFPVGIDVDIPRRTTVVALPAGSSICLYTDGLVERRGNAAQTPHDDPLGRALEQLRDAYRSERPEDAVARMIAAMMGTATADDDIAILTLRRTESTHAMDPVALAQHGA